MTNTLIDYLAFMVLTRLFSIPLDRVWLAKLLSGGLAMTVSFLLNRDWVFRFRDAQRAAQAVRFALTSVGASWGVQLGLVQFFSSIWPVPGVSAFNVLQYFGIPTLAPTVVTQAAIIKSSAFVLATCASMTWNFALYRLWVFRGSESERRAESASS